MMMKSEQKLRIAEHVSTSLRVQVSLVLNYVCECASEKQVEQIR